MKKLVLKITGFLCLVVLLTSTAFAQSRTITGTVIDSESQPVIGAVVNEMGTSNGTVTVSDGSFSITSSATNVKLKISYVGFTTQTIDVGNQTNLSVRMSSDESLSEVVVTAAGVKRSSRSVGYALSSVSAKEITEGGDRSVLNGMQGKVAGVTINSASSNPGASSRIVIRGVQSISQGNQPLIVIDGVPMTNSSVNSTSLNGGFDFGNGLNAVNPDDIENIQILKGSSASALYGSRAANGVVLITTKKGSTSSKGKKAIGVDVGFDATYSTPLRLPNLQNTYGQGWSGNHWLDENGSWGPIMDGKKRVFGQEVDNSQLLAPYSPLEDNVRDFFELGTNYRTHVGVNGGGENNSFYASYSNVSQDGIIPTDADQYTRNTVAFRGSQNFGKLTVDGSINLAMTNSQFVPSGQQENSVYRNILDIPRNMSVIDMANYKDKFYNINDYFTPYGVTNPYWALNENKNDFSSNKFFGGLTAKMDIMGDLKGVYSFGYDIENHDISRYEAIAKPVGQNEDVKNDGFVSEQTIGNQQFNHDFKLLWNKDVNKLINIDLIGGLNLNERSSTSLFSSVSALDIAGFYNLSNSPSTPSVDRNDNMRRLVGLYGVASASYKDYLYLNLSARNDWSSTLPQENNSFFYPAANLSFVFTDVVSGLPSWMGMGKFRVGYGSSGNDAPIYVINSIYTQASHSMPFRSFSYPLATGTNAFTAGNRIKNPDLQPELTKELEIGTDLLFYDNRVSLEFTYYNRVTEGQILQVPVSPGSGSSNFYANAATVENKGIELALTYKVLRNENGFNWAISGNMTRNKNEVLDLDDALDRVSLGGLSTTAYYAMQGMPIGVFEGNTYKYSPDGKVVVDESGVPVVGDEKEIYGNSQRDYIIGLKNSFSYKQFSLGILLDIRKGGLMYSNTKSMLSWTGHAITTTYNDRKPFIVPNSVIEDGVDENGDPVYVENTTPVAPGVMHEYHTADARDRQFVFDKSYTKLREVNLTYRLPSSMLESMPFAGASVSIIGRNLLLWTPVENQFIDPEVTTFGNGNQAEFGEFVANPTARSFGFSLKFNF